MLKSSLAAQATNDLELLALEEVYRRHTAQGRVDALDIPCGNGQFSALLAQAGAQVIASDTVSVSNEVGRRALAAGVADQVSLQALAPSQVLDVKGGPFDLVFCRHGLHTLRYPEAMVVVRNMLSRLKIGGKLFVSAYGLYSRLGDGYPAADALLPNRYARLDPAIAEQYGITGPVCLYTERNLVNLLFEAGAGVLRTFTTTHGTVKAVGVRL